MTILTSAAADAIVHAAIACGRDHDFIPLTVAVLDAGGRFVPVPGGVLIRNDDGAVIGAVGVSGDTSDKDEVCAIAGIKMAGFTADPADPVSGWEKSRL